MLHYCLTLNTCSIFAVILFFTGPYMVSPEVEDPEAVALHGTHDRRPRGCGSVTIGRGAKGCSGATKWSGVQEL